MEIQEKTKAVQKMQDYILTHLDETITLEELGRAAGYSPWYSSRLFKELTGWSPAKFIRSLRITRAAKSLRDSDTTVLDLALREGFDSPDGFTRAFYRSFQIRPMDYKRQTPPVPYFTYYPVQNYRQLTQASELARKQKRKGIFMVENDKVSECKSNSLSTVTVTVVERPRRKLIILRSKEAEDYLSYCTEMGCDWEGLLNSIPEKMDDAAILTLPPNLLKQGFSAVASGVEVPDDYDKPLPAGYEIVELAPCKLLYFQGMPFEREEQFCEAIQILLDSMEHYEPKRFGLRFAPELSPSFNFGASAELGARAAVPACSKDDFSAVE